MHVRLDGQQLGQRGPVEAVVRLEVVASEASGQLQRSTGVGRREEPHAGPDDDGPHPRHGEDGQLSDPPAPPRAAVLDDDDELPGGEGEQQEEALGADVRREAEQDAEAGQGRSARRVGGHDGSRPSQAGRR